MKIFKINAIMVVLFSCIVTSFVVARDPYLSSTMAAYNNKISQISYSVGSHDQHAITFLCQKNPICMYTPLRFEDIDSNSLTKTYFLPCTQCEKSHMQKFYKDLHTSFQELGINLTISDMEDLNYGVRKHHGVRLSFTMEPDHRYDISKVIDSDKKTVSFNLSPKI